MTLWLWHWRKLSLWCLYRIVWKGPWELPGTGQSVGHKLYSSLCTVVDTKPACAKSVKWATLSMMTYMLIWVLGVHSVTMLVGLGYSYLCLCVYYWVYGPGLCIPYVQISYTFEWKLLSLDLNVISYNEKWV